MKINRVLGLVMKIDGRVVIQCAQCSEAKEIITSDASPAGPAYNGQQLNAMYEHAMGHPNQWIGLPDSD